MLGRQVLNAFLHSKKEEIDPCAYTLYSHFLNFKLQFIFFLNKESNPFKKKTHYKMHYVLMLLFYIYYNVYNYMY